MTVSMTPVVDVGCAAALPEQPPLGVRIPPTSKKPNFIIILTDDQGYDDIGLHQPQKPGGKPTWVNTPNLDKFIKQGVMFSNFYVAPMCSQTRSMLLTGRDFPRTGTMLINGGERQADHRYRRGQAVHWQGQRYTGGTAVQQHWQ